MQSVLITLLTVAYRDDTAEREEGNLIVPGKMLISEDGRHAELYYEETVDETEPSEQVSVIIENNSVNIARSGVYSSDLYFQACHRHQSEYSTPAGSFELSVYCTNLSVNVDKQGGTIELCYQVDIAGQFVAMHEVHMEIDVLKESDEQS